jgi:hypothetical protein
MQSVPITTKFVSLKPVQNAISLCNGPIKKEQFVVVFRKKNEYKIQNEYHKITIHPTS